MFNFAPALRSILRMSKAIAPPTASVRCDVLAPTTPLVKLIPHRNVWASSKTPGFEMSVC